MKTLTKAVNTLATAFAYIGVVCVLAMMLFTVADVFCRFLVNKAIVGNYEIMTHLFFVSLYAGFAYCQVTKGHVHVTMLVYHMRKIPKFVIWSINSLLSAATGFALAVAAWQQSGKVALSGEYSDIFHLPRAPFYMFASIGLFLFAIVLLLDAVKSVLALFHNEYADEVTSTWVG